MVSAKTAQSVGDIRQSVSGPNSARTLLAELDYGVSRGKLPRMDLGHASTDRLSRRSTEVCIGNALQDKIAAAEENAQVLSAAFPREICNHRGA